MIYFVDKGDRISQEELGEGCTDEIYGILTQCWHEDPAQRPTFTKLVYLMQDSLRRNRTSSGLKRLLPAQQRKSYAAAVEAGTIVETDMDDVVSLNNSTSGSSLRTPRATDWSRGPSNGPTAPKMKSSSTGYMYGTGRERGESSEYGDVPDHARRPSLSTGVPVRPL